MNDGGPAFPISGEDVHWRGHGGDLVLDPLACGITLRDYFAAAALQGLIHIGADPQASVKVMAEWSYKFADAMLAARQREE